MKIGILGTGSVGRTLSARLVELGHDVVIGTRDVAATEARAEEPFPAPLATAAAAAADAELIINATSGQVSVAALTGAGAENLAGKVVIDISNPLDFSQGFPPFLSVCNTDSVGEQVQRAFPEARVVKTLNTVTAAVMARPENVAGGDHTLFLSGNDADAKATVAELLREFGWRDIVDLGDITTARGTEMMLPLWVRLMNALGTTEFNYKLVR
ncbi:NAD(P)-binding domain-containing protein [Nocardia sp. CDC153]|uniref:NADPH-dependent F420 reductase n=1 Tax=Nocardia sp. CDC153 TaxID=3112167 RepID=UPI002DBEBA86|nr:NAD(P)-binding domain-containing protein [Nocardia sp. CDC153]MEC3954817.1 NAD(P)-binding domain-containing protein [Nocardia sp. CDC153]